MNTIKPVQDTKGRATTRTAASGPDFSSKSVSRHLARGVIGFGVIVGSIALVPIAGPAALLAAPLALIAFRGCPTCWMVGLMQTISRGRLERECVDGVCTLTKAHPADKAAEEPTPHQVPAASR